MTHPDDQHARPAPAEPVRPFPTAAEIRDWLVAHLARIVRCAPQEIDVTASFDRLGLDSATAVGVTLDLEDWLGHPIEPAIFYDYPSIQQLADELARAGAAQPPSAGADPSASKEAAGGGAAGSQKRPWA